MRIIVAGPPKSGNTWVECLLSTIYQLDIIKRPPKNMRELKERIANGKYPDNSIFHQHLIPTSTMKRFKKRFGFHFVTVLRDPYDTFVSLYFYAQNYPRKFGPERKLHAIVNKPLDHPDVLDFLSRYERGYGSNLRMAEAWLTCDQTNIIRYEDMIVNPVHELDNLTMKIEQVDNILIKDAINSCSAEKMRKQNRKIAKLVRKAAAGDWKNHLTEKHLDIFRQEHAEIIRTIGYKVR